MANMVENFGYEFRVVGWQLPAEIVNAPLKIQITATIFVYHFVYPNGVHIKKCMHANELDRLWW